MPSQDKVAALQATLAGLSGPARILRRVELSGALCERSWRVGLDTPAGRGDFDAAIAIVEEVRRDPQLIDPLRGPMTQRLGMLLGIRHLLAPNGAEQDRVRAIELLTESLDVPGLPPAAVTAGRLMLSQLHLAAVSRGLDSVSLSAMLRGDAAEYRAEADLAIAHAKRVAEAPVVNAGLSSMARMLVKAAETLRGQIDMMEMMDGAVAGLDQGLLQRLLNAVQGFEAQSGAAGGAPAGFSGGGGPVGQPFLPPQLLGPFLTATFAGSPLNQPTIVVNGPEPEAETEPAAAAPSTPEPAPAASPVDVDRLRAALAGQFAELASTTGGTQLASAGGSRPAETDPAGVGPAAGPPEAYLSAAALLRPDTPPLPVDAVDECVALATTVVHEATATDPVAAGLDRFLLAVALFLRARHDADADADTEADAEAEAEADGTGYPEGNGHPEESGWTDGNDWTGAAGDAWGDGGSGDLGAGLDSLLRAAETLPPEHRAATELCTGLGAFLDDRQPLRGLTAPAARGLADWADAVLAARLGHDADLAAPSDADADLSVIRAVGAVCRAVGTVPTGSSGGASALGELVAAVPDGYPWRFRLRAAVGVIAVAGALADKDLPALRTAGTLLAEAVASAPARYARTPGLRELGRLAAVLGALDRDDPLLCDVATVLLGPVAPAGAPADGRRQPPMTSPVAAALRRIDAAALVCLYPVPGRPHRVGLLLMDARTGKLSLFGPVTASDPAADVSPAGWADPARAALVEPLLALPITGSAPRRVLVAAAGAAGRLPLHAIRTGAGGHAASDLIVSYVRSGRQVVELARRAPLPVTEDAVFVANPRGDRDLATFEAMTLRRLYHPRSTGLGRTVEAAHGAGTPADVLAHLPGPAGPGAGLLHLGCTLRATGSPGLELADPGEAGESGEAAGRAVLDIARIAAQAGAAPGQEAGGLAILPADVGAHHDRWVPFADALLDAGLTGVIGWLWPVPEPVATLMLLVLHGKLVDDGLPAATAVHEVHRWMRDLDRSAPPYLPPGAAAALFGTDLADPRYWAALCHRGR